MADKKKTDKHHGAAGDGFDLVPTKKDGTPAKNDKYGNPVTEGTGKGKGVVLKNYYQISNKNISAPSPEEIVKHLTRPYWSINSMPIEYVFTSIIEYFNSLIEPIYKRIPVLDDEGNPIKDSDGKEIEQTALVNYAYKNVPTRYGLAQALGVSLTTLDGYLRVDNSNNDSSKDNSGNNSHSKGYTSHQQNTNPNRDNHLISMTDLTEDSIYISIYGEDVLYDDGLRERLCRKTEKDVKVFLLKRAMSEIMQFHEQRLGLNENVTGSLFALLNSRDGWTNDHTVKVEFPDLLGKIRTTEELDAMKDLEEPVIVMGEKDGVFTPITDFDDDE